MGRAFSRNLIPFRYGFCRRFGFPVRFAELRKDQRDDDRDHGDDQ
jgi:hypothetical protein